MKKDDYAIKNGSGLDLIIKERERQISEEGFTPEKDKKNNGGELAVAAACYAVAGMCECGEGTFVGRTDDSDIVDGWPRGMDKKWDKRLQHDPLRRLTIAGALIAAEIDRIEALGKVRPLPIKEEALKGQKGS
jgi:hypothetical protein